jgi:predicted O-methyltransferase YrrM
VRDALEIGTSNGVSTVWLAEALSSTGGADAQSSSTSSNVSISAAS